MGYCPLTRRWTALRENFELQGETVQVKPNDQIGAGCLQSVDDQEASFRRKNPLSSRAMSPT